MSSDHDGEVWRSLAGWQEFMSLRYPGVRVFSQSRERSFCTRYRSWQLGSLEFAEIHSISRQSIHVPLPEKIATSSYFLPLQLNGDFHGEQYGRACDAGDRSMLLVDSHAPHWRELGANSRLLNVRIPKPMLERYLDDPRALCMTPVRADAGQGALLWGFINDLWKRRAELDTAGMYDLEDALARMVASLFGTLRGEHAGASGVVAHQRCKILKYIDENLNAPELDASDVAAACGISLRYVHTLMHGTGRTFSQYLLEHRLERCRSILASQQGNLRPITEIAFAWGFNDASHFSRSFRNRYGMSPREFRCQAHPQHPR